ncbi:hypothetical protein VU04_09080 [Desulfobulbus sp. TB]|nr:hypothetical protein [Desulfobulbus sp. TB]
MKFRHIVMLATVFYLAAICSASAYEAEIKKMSTTMAEKIAATKKAKIAVVDFTNLRGDVTELGRFVAEEFSVALVGAGKGFKVVDRTHLKSIIKENKLSATGLIDPATARKLGKIAGVDALITGTLTSFGDSVRIAVKILDASTAEVVDAISGNIAKTEAVKVLLATSLTNMKEVPPGDKGKGKAGQSLQTVEAGGFRFQLVSGKVSDGTVTFSFLITSLEKNNDLGMGSSSRLIDYEGNEYKASRVTIGSSSHWGHVSNTLIAGVPVKGSLYFKGVSQKIKGAALLEVTCGFKVQFRNIPLSK